MVRRKSSIAQRPTSRSWICFNSGNKSKDACKNAGRLCHAVKYLLAVVALISGLFHPVLVSAIGVNPELDCVLSGSCYYNPKDNAADCTVAVGSASGEQSAGLTPAQSAFVDMYQEIASQLSIAYGIPWETVVAQGIIESAAGTSNFAVQRNNFFGIGAFDENPDNAYSYESPTEGWKGYYENIRKTPTYRNHGVFSGDTITDPQAYLVAIKAAGYATDPDYVSKISAFISAIEARSQEKGWQSSAELAASHPEMLEHAAENANGSSEAPEVGTDSDACVTGGNGDINKTAIELSWPDRSHAPTDPKTEYRTALQETGVSVLGDACSMGGYSCDAFVATVLRYSGVDPDMPCCGAANQLAYFLSHPEKYEEIPNLGNTSNMQPGDIRSSSDHIELLIQLDNGEYRIASASHCDRTADHGIGFYPNPAMRIFRKK